MIAVECLPINAEQIFRGATVFKHVCVSRKLQILFGTLALLVGGQSFVMFYGFASMRTEFAFAVDHRVSLMQGASRFDNSVEGMRSGVLTAVAQVGSSEGIAAGRHLYGTSLESANSALERISAVAGTVRTRQQLEQGRELLNTIRTTDEEILGFAEAGDRARALDGLSRVTPSLEQCISLAREMVKRQDESLVQDKAAVSGEQSRYSWISTFMIIACIISATLTYLVVHNISVTLRQLTIDLTHGAEQLAATSGELSSSSQSLAEGASEQAASLQETANSADGISSMTRRNAEHSQAATVSVHTTTALIEQGNQRLTELVTSMQEIGSSSAKISNIIKTIDEIAFHTNILALNASVEAARAGEAGKGFAVVADEVRNLAQRCATAAQETSTLIEESIHNAQRGSEKVSGVASAIQEITAESERVKILVEGVSSDSRKQEHGLDQITSAISQLERVTQRIAATSEQSAATSQHLHSQSRAINNVVSSLAAFVGDAGGGHLAAELGSGRQALPIRQSVLA